MNEIKNILETIAKKRDGEKIIEDQGRIYVAGRDLTKDQKKKEN